MDAFANEDRPAEEASWWAAGLALALPAALFLATLYPGIGDRAASGDAVEFQIVGRVLGVAHEPGYPQYVLLSFLWSWLPLPLDLATRINLLSAVFALAAGGFLFATARSRGVSGAASVLACWALLTGPDLWRLATQAEVYTLHALWVTVFFWAGLRWRRSGGRRDLLVLLFAYALAFGNHLTMIALLPALGFLLITRQPRLVADFSAWAWAAIAAAVGAAQYLLLVWRSYFPHPTLLERFPLRAAPGELLAYVTGGRFVDKHWLPLDSGELLARVGQAASHGVGQLTPLFAALALYGVVVAWRREPAQAAFFVIAASSILLFAAAYDIRDWLLYCLPAWIVAALLAAEGTSDLMRRWPRAGLVLGLALGLVLAPRILRGVDELRVAANPSDLSRVLSSLPTGSRVLAAGGQRLARLHADYYRYGAGLDSAERLRFMSARQDFLGKALHLRRRGFFFRSPTVAKILGGRLIDFRPWPRYNGPGEPVLVTGTADPLTRVELRALPGAELELTVRGERRRLDESKDLYLFFVAARDGRAKGLEALDLGDEAAADRLRLLLGALPAGDAVVALVPRLRAPAREAIGKLLTAAGPGAPDAATRRLVAAWRQDGDRKQALLWQDPDDGVVWAINLGAL